MLKATKGRREGYSAEGGEQFAIVASRYNTRYVEAMVRAAKGELVRARVKEIRIVRVPGAYEIPLAAKGLARTGREARLGAIICLGVILRGETAHADLIGEAVTRALMEIQLDYELPVIHEVLLLANEQQARVRCLGQKHNRGAEAAQTALAMAEVLRHLPGKT
jgi:6,7-dimethyl-8-ribityllumazine synthase